MSDDWENPLERREREVLALRRDIEALTNDPVDGLVHSGISSMNFEKFLGLFLDVYKNYYEGPRRDMLALNTYADFANAAQELAGYAERAGDKGGSARRTIERTAEYLKANCPDLDLMIERGYEVAKAELELQHETARASIARLKQQNSPGANL